jgi:hypothetical protein
MPDLIAPSPPGLLTAPPVGSSGAWARAAADLAAAAVSVDGTAAAYATVPTGVEALAPQVTVIEGSGALVGQATSNLSAKATTVGDGLGSDSAIALVDGIGAAVPLLATGVITSGLNLSANSTTIGKSAQLFGQAVLDASAAATTVEGDASAGSASLSSIGITLDGQTVSIGAVAEITAQADANISAQANAVEGNAESVATGGVTAGLTEIIPASGIVAVGADSTVVATANSDISAQSTTVIGSGNASLFGGPTIASQAKAGELNEVKGLDIASLSIGGNASIKASGTTQQQATASSVKAGNLTNEGSFASSSDGSQIRGAIGTVIEVGNTLSKSSFTGSANSIAQAQSVEGNSTTVSGNTEVSGADKINLSVGRSITDTLTFDASLISSSNALSTEGLALSTAGNYAGGGTMGLRDSDLQVGANAYVITANAINQINSNAAATNPSASPLAPATGQVEANASSFTSAINGSSIDVGGSAPIKGTATTVVNATATNTGNPFPLAPAITGFTSLASVVSDTSGVFLAVNPAPVADKIVIGNQGSVLGQSATQSRSIATSINSPTGSSGTSASTNVVQTGVELSAYDSTIEIGGKGSIEGISIFGGPQGSLSASSPILVQASSVADLVSASVIPGSMSAGILGTLDPTLGTPAGFSSLIAGPAGGNISGRSNSALEATAKNVGTSTSDTSTATIGTPGLTLGMASMGISQVDMQAGLSGKDNITGASTLNSAISSESVQGNSSSSGNLISAGISNWSYALGTSQPAIAGNASVSGSMSAISQMLNTSVAQTVYGSADSSLATQNTGLLQYNVTMADDGNLQAIATSQASSKTTSVHGSA